MKIAVFFLGLISFSALANEIELSISDQLIDLRLTSQFEQDFSGRLSYMHSDDEDIDADQLSYTFSTKGKVDLFDIMLGARLFLLDAESQDGYGVALGGGASMEVIDKLTLGVEAFFSPDIITGGDLENTLEIDFRAGYQLIDNGTVFLGYRIFEVDTDVGDIDIYDGAYVGIKFTF